MNLVEVWFGIVERQTIRRGVFTSDMDLNTKIRAFIDGWNDRSPPSSGPKPQKRSSRRPTVQQLQIRGTSLESMLESEPPILGLSGFEAAEILGVSELYVARLVSQGVLPRARPHQRHGLDRNDVEQLALERYKPGHTYWANTVEAAAVLGVSRERVRQLVATGRLPAVDHGGRRYYRRHQLEVIANARQSRLRS